MSAPVEFGLAALLVSGGAALSLQVARSAPPRLKFWIAMLGLGAWAVPWPLVALPVPVPVPLPALLAGAGAVAGWAGEAARAAVGYGALAGPTASLESASFAPLLLWTALSAPGLAWFAFDYAGHRRTLRAWRRASGDGRALWPLLPPALARREAPAGPIAVRVVADSEAAAATGVLRPTLWIGERLTGEALRTALVHEYCHVRALDPLWLILIRLLKRAYCWNPLVLVLARQADLWIEAACDDRCARLLGRRRYRQTLARLILSAQRPPHGAATLLGAASGNLRRLDLLGRKAEMGWREYACIGLCAATCVGAVGPGAAPRDPRLGKWAEVGRSAPDEEPILRSFEDLGGGRMRMRSDVLADGTAALSADYRCDGRGYVVRERSGAPTQWRLACRVLDARSAEVALSAADGTHRRQVALDRVSADGETYTSTAVTPAPGAAEARSTARVYWRLH